MDDPDESCKWFQVTIAVGRINRRSNDWLLWRSLQVLESLKIRRKIAFVLGHIFAE
jgi:hypothetical protein